MKIKPEGVLNHVAAFAMAGALFVGAAGITNTARAQTAAAPTAEGQSDTLQEVVVTAERRSEDEQKVGASISVRNGVDMEEQGRYSLTQILEDVPGVVGGAAINSQSSLGSGTDSPSLGLTIRGIPSNAGAASSITSTSPAAAIYVDGVYEGVGGNYDIDRVEVLLGPQGTLYGRSATTGLVAIHTFDPSLDHFGGDAMLEFGDNALWHYEGALDAPLVDDVLGIRVSGDRYQRDGYYTSDGGALTDTDGRVKLLFRPSQDFSVLVGAALQDNTTHTGGATISLSTPNTYAFTPAPVGPGDNDFRQYWALVTWNLGPATLTYQPAFRTWDSDGLVVLALPFGLFEQTVDTPKDNFETQELRLASNPGSTLIWQVGSLYYDNDLSNTSRAELSGLQVFKSQVLEKTTRAAGVFGEATYPFASSWRVTAGLRYDYTKVAVDQAYTSITGVTQYLDGDAGIRTFDNVTYKARLEHDLSAQNLLYASISTGFSPGDIAVATGATGNPIPLELKAETLTAYEIGSKNRFFDNKLQLNGAIYYYHYAAYQSAGINLNPSDPAAPVFASVGVPAQAYGGELQALFQATAHDRAAFNFAYTNSYYVDKNGTLISTGGGNYVSFAEFYAEDKFAGVVPIQASLSYEHILDLPGSNLTLHGDVRYLSSNYGTGVSESQASVGALTYVSVGAQVVGDLSTTWATNNGRYSITGYVRNVGDNRYKTFPPTLGGVTGGPPPPGTPIAVTTVPYDPRTFGVVINVRF